MDLIGWGSGIKRILFGVFSNEFEEFQKTHNCKSYGDLEPLYYTVGYPRIQYSTPFHLDRIIVNICEEADSIYFLLDDLSFITKDRFNSWTNKIEHHIPAPLVELHIILSELDYIKKTTFFKGPHKYIIEPERVYEWWTNVQ